MPKRDWRRWDQEKRKAAYKRWYDRNREAESKRKHAYAKDLMNCIFEELGNRCAVCGIDDKIVLQIDHVKGDGWKERASGTRYRSLLLKEYRHGLLRDKYQLLCANCHVRKTRMNDEYRQISNGREAEASCMTLFKHPI